MKTLIVCLSSLLRRFAGSERGSAAVEFVLALPIVLMIAFTTYEAGMLNLRQVMLDRGVDVTVRAVRTGRLPDPDHDTLKDAICEAAQIIPDCQNQVKLEMVTRNLRDWRGISTRPDCIDRAEEAEPLINFTTGGNNELMILRVCALYDPVMPNAVLGASIPKESEGAYALTAMTAFVMEPYKE